MADSTLPIEFNASGTDFPETLQAQADRRLHDLKGTHTDMVGAAVTVEPIGQGQHPYRFEARIVVYGRPDRVVASEKADQVKAAVKGALDAIERQVRQARGKRREHWKRPDLNDSPRA